MCGLCGLFGGGHWTDGPGDDGDARPALGRWRRARAADAALGFYGLRLSPWGGRYVLAGRTGKSALVDDLGALWPAAERLAGRACDPLDPDLLDRLEAAGG